MPYVEYLEEWDSQPQEPVEIDWSNPLTQSIKGAFSALTASQLVNAVAGVLPTSDNGIARISPSGVMRDYVSGQKSTFANRADYGLAGAMTIVVIADVDTLTNYGALLSCQDSATTNGWELRLGVGATDSRLDFVRANAGYRQFAASASNLIASGTKNNFISGSFPTADINTSPTFSVNGVEYVAGASFDGTGTGDAIASTSTLDIGARAAGITRLDGAVLFAAIWNRALSFAELERIRANPWQIFGPIERRIQVASAGGITANAAITQASNTASSAAALTIAASAAITQASNTASSAAALTIAASAAQAQASDTAAATATLAADTITANAAITQASNTASSAAALTIAASAAQAQASNTASSAAALTIAASAAQAQASNTATSTAALTIVSALTTAQANNTASSTAALTVAAASTITQASNTLTASAFMGTLTARPGFIAYAAARNLTASAPSRNYRVAA